MKIAPAEFFRWYRPVGAVYRWEKKRAFLQDPEESGSTKILAAETTFLLDANPDEAHFQDYEPLTAHPDLFHTFAKLDPTATAFAVFANQFGALGVWVKLLDERVPNVDFIWGFGEPLYRWVDEHARMKRIADIVIAVREGNADVLRQWVRVWESGARFEWELGATGYKSWALICDTRHDHRTALWKWACDAKSESEKLLRLASGYAQEQINAAMSGEKSNETASTTRLLFDVEQQAISMFLAPSTLLAAMWLQAASALVTIPEVTRICTHCGRAFSVAISDGRRRDAKYCSDRCKVAAHRGRNIFAWMSVYYRAVRSRDDWRNLSESDRIAALRARIAREPQHSGSVLDVDVAGWPRAMRALEESWLLAERRNRQVMVNARPLQHS